MPYLWGINSGVSITAPFCPFALSSSRWSRQLIRNNNGYRLLFTCPRRPHPATAVCTSSSAILPSSSLKATVPGFSWTGTSSSVHDLSLVLHVNTCSCTQGSFSAWLAAGEECFMEIWTHSTGAYGVKKLHSLQLYAPTFSAPNEAATSSPFSSTSLPDGNLAWLVTPLANRVLCDNFFCGIGKQFGQRRSKNVPQRPTFFRQVLKEASRERSTCFITSIVVDNIHSHEELLVETLHA